MEREPQISSREKILRCAYELFYTDGYQATSVDDILARCKVAKSNFYYHFKSKDDLAFEVLGRQTAEFENLALQTLGDKTRMPSARMSHFAEQLVYTQAKVRKMGGCPFGNFAAGLSNGESDARATRFRAVLSHLFQQMEEALRECLEEGIAAGEFRGDIPPRDMAAFLLATVEGLMLLTKTHQEADVLEKGLEVAQKLIQAG